MSSSDWSGWASTIAGVVSAVAAVAALRVSRSDSRPSRDVSKFMLLGVAVVALMFAIAAFVVTVYPSPEGSDSAAVPLPGSPSPSASSSSPAPCAPSLTMTSPVADRAVQGATGVVISGTAQCLGDFTGWLFELDSEDHYYYAIGDDGLSITSDGPWSVADFPIGGPGDHQKQYTITLLLASPQCAAALEALPVIDGDRKHRRHPTGCTEVAAIPIRVSY